MTRAGFAAAAFAALASPHPAARNVWVDVGLTREGDALLTPFLVAIALHNPTGRVVRLRFPTADLFRIDVLRDDQPVWSSATNHKPIPITRQLDVPPGLTKLAQQLVDGTTDDRRAFAPGAYVVRVSMLWNGSGGVVADKPLVFSPPATIAQAIAAKPGTVLTIAGEPFVDGGIPRLRDGTATIRLSHTLALRPSGRWIVRGFLDAQNDERVFDVGRAAPAFENTPSPAPGPP